MGSRPIRVFLDANVIISAAASPRPLESAAVAVLDVCARGLAQAHLSRQVLSEVERTVSGKRPEQMGKLGELLAAVSPVVLPDPPESAVARMRQVINRKDAPILAAAVEADVDFLVTRDLRHFHRAEVSDAVTCRIVDPAQFLRVLAEGLSGEAFGPG
ncbi:MAG: putative toxin-antitoxin system toxin component, PIN family [Armatimonadota bacterium]